MRRKRSTKSRNMFGDGSGEAYRFLNEFKTTKFSSAQKASGADGN